MTSLNMNIPKIENDACYWIVRSGVEAKYFEQFYNDKCIALGWDKITNINMIKEQLNADSLKNIVEEEYLEEIKEIKSNASSISRKITDISNKIYKFVVEMKVGDFIVTPGTDEILIGIVEGEAKLVEGKFNKISEKKEEKLIGELNKVRTVTWLKRVGREQMEPHLRLILGIYHGIAKISEEQAITEINRMIYDFYVINNTGHTTYRINDEAEIDFQKYANFIYHVNGIYNVLKDDFEDSRLTIKTNIQSPGPIELIGETSLVSCILAGISSLLKNNDKGLNKLSDPIRKKLEDYKEENPNEIDYDDYDFPGMGTY